MGQAKRRKLAGIYPEQIKKRIGYSAEQVAGALVSTVIAGAYNPRFDEPEIKSDKGLKNGSCNRRACQRPGATWFNRGTRKFYCRNCAYLINRDNRDAFRYIPEVKEGEFLCVEETDL